MMVSLIPKIVRALVSPKLIVTNANIAAVAGLIKQDSSITVKNISHSVGISLGS